MTTQPESREEYAARKSRTLADEFDDATGNLVVAARYCQDVQTSLNLIRQAATDDALKADLARLLRINGIVRAQIANARGHVSEARRLNQ